MNKGYNTLLYFFMFYTLHLSAQRIDKYQPLRFSDSKMAKPIFLPSLTNSFYLFDNQPFLKQKNVPYTLDNAVHYTAFFCNMELKIVERYNVWIKVHAGDYDTYSKVAYQH